MKNLVHLVAISILAIAIFSGCMTMQQEKINYNVTSNPPGSPVEVNGVFMGNTPTTIWLAVSKSWVGLLNSPDGWGYGNQSYVVKCLPPPNASGPLYTQTKVINPSMTPQGGDLYFDLRLEPIKATQPVEIK